METSITEDGDHFVLVRKGSAINKSSRSKVIVLENDDGATVVVGENVGGTDVAVNKPYIDGDIATEGGVFAHGVGEKLVVTVTGITSNPVLIRHRSA